MNIIKKYIKATRDSSKWGDVRKKWISEGATLPPPHESKRLCILEKKRKYKNNILIETGTFMGDMASAMSPYFKEIYTIELSEDLYKKTSEELSCISNINFLHGDSTYILPEILKNINEPAIFWLDGHYSAGITARGEKDTPIMEELTAIKNSKFAYKHIILIDDARLFTENSDQVYPKLVEIERWVEDNLPNASMIVENDVIVISSK
jgi:hypothetical protein